MEKIYSDKKIERDTMFPNVLPPISIDLLELHIDEAATRTNLADRLRGIFGKIGDEDLGLSIQKGKVPSSEADLVYQGLTDFILKDPENNARIILYLPFQILPNLNSNNSLPAQEFAKTLHDGWICLLFVSEVRANFDDGDELEPGLGDPPRTRKAAHLLPEFLRLGIISTQETTSLLEISDEAEMAKALFEGMVVSNGKKLFDPFDWERILNLAKEKDVINILEKGNTPEDTFDRPLEAIKEDLKASLEVIELMFSNESEYVKRVSKKRIIWEKGVKIDEAVENTSRLIAQKLINGEILPSETEKLGAVGIRSLIRYAEAVALKNPKKAKISVEKIIPTLNKFWLEGTQTEREEVRVGANHLDKLDVLPDYFLNNLGIKKLDLSQTLPIDIYDFTENDGKWFIEAAKIIEKDSYLSEYVYPFFLVFGSKIKGYADQNGDFDFAIFIKPETPFEKREEILSRLKTDVPEIANIDRILEYWVAEKDRKFGLKPVPKNSPNLIVGAAQIHFLFGGIWIGKGEEIQKLRADLTSRYLDLSRFEKQKDMVRSKLLGQLELDALQYRLMHKGFRKNYPSRKGLPPKYGNLIDWKSDFWDPGYRRIATNLFLKKVFLPDLSEN